jgi:RNA polymerase primary sigma factor
VNRTYHAIAEASNKFLQDFERFPTDAELTDIIERDYGIKIANMEDVFKTSVTYIDSSINDDEDNSNVSDGCLEFNKKCSSYNIYEEEVENDYSKSLALSLINKLSKRERKVITMLYGIGYEREYSFQEISWEINLSAERVRQISIGALERLKYRVESMSLKK